MMEIENSTMITYSPAAVLILFNNSISINQTKLIVQLKGIYIPADEHHESNQIPRYYNLKIFKCPVVQICLGLHNLLAAPTFQYALFQQTDIGH